MLFAANAGSVAKTDTESVIFWLIFFPGPPKRFAALDSSLDPALNRPPSWLFFV